MNRDVTRKMVDVRHFSGIRKYKIFYSTACSFEKSCYLRNNNKLEMFEFGFDNMPVKLYMFTFLVFVISSLLKKQIKAKCPIDVI